MSWPPTVEMRKATTRVEQALQEVIDAEMAVRDIEKHQQEVEADAKKYAEGDTSSPSGWKLPSVAAELFGAQMQSLDADLAKSLQRRSKARQAQRAAEKEYNDMREAIEESKELADIAEDQDVRSHYQSRSSQSLQGCDFQERPCPFKYPHSYIPEYLGTPSTLPYTEMNSPVKHVEEDPIHRRHQELKQECRKEKSPKRQSSRRSQAKSERIADSIVPEASESDWVRREIHRRQGIQHIKSTEAYSRVARLENHNVERPRTPDPTDRSMSKRDWEISMQRWRGTLQNIMQQYA